MIAQSLIYNVGLLFLMMIPGVLMTKCKLSTEGLGKGLSNLVLYIAQPALIVHAYIRPYEEAVLYNALGVFLLSILSHLIFAGVALLCYRHAEDGARKILRFATIFSNAAFMGMPLLVAVLNEEAAIYASIYSITFNLFLWSLGVILCTGDRNQASFLKILWHPVTLSSVVGLLCFFLPIDGYVPSLVMEGLVMLKSLVAPLSMIVIGLRLANMNFRGLFRDRYLYEFLFLRLLLLPAIVWGIMRLLQLCGVPLNDTVMTVILVTASTPAATATSMFAERYDCDAAYSGKLVSLSTVLSVLTMPLVSMLLTI